MARRIPKTGPWGDDRAEQRVLKFLAGVFADRDDVTIWCKPVVGGLEPDILLYGPDFGLCVVEVKGWSVPIGCGQPVKVTRSLPILSCPMPKSRPTRRQ